MGTPAGHPPPEVIAHARGLLTLQESITLVSALRETESVKSIQLCPTLCYAMDYIACQAPLSMDSPGKNTGVGCHFLLQEFFPTQGLYPGVLHCRQILNLLV